MSGYADVEWVASGPIGWQGMADVHDLQKLLTQHRLKGQWAVPLVSIHKV